ncbi:hypothetical protein BC827DRAFT_145611 [Russula dissimulans]|nr:hypothetical protein BC827DRAFT_145611 [Russula dissimulans]
MMSSGASPDVGFTGMALPPSEPVVELPAMSNDLSSLHSGNAKSSQENFIHVASVDLSCSGASSGDPLATLPPTVLGYSSCMATAANAETETQADAPNNASDNVDVFLTHHVADPEPKLHPLAGPTGAIPSLDSSDSTDVHVSSAGSESHLNSREVQPCAHIQPHVCDEETVLDSTLGALSPLSLVESLTRSSSPSFPVQISCAFMHLTPPPSSPQTDCNLPVRSMSSPSFILHEDESSLSPSPPLHTTKSTKRAQYDESDEDSTSVTPVKRIRMDETMSSPLRNAPAPSRSTLAFEKLTRKKLVTPFRLPLLIKKPSTQPATPIVPGQVPQKRIAGELRAKTKIVPTAQEAPTSPKTVKSLVRSSRAARQFKSPLANALERKSRPVVLPSQAVKNLENKIAILKRAIKIKRDGDEGHLERLAKKWRDAGREAAHELWGIVRDLSPEGGEIRGNDKGWGWNDQEERGTIGEDGLGEEESKQEITLGVMLRNLGIAPETLGWNDEEEAFVDND